MSRLSEAISERVLSQSAALRELIASVPLTAMGQRLARSRRALEAYRRARLELAWIVAEAEACIAERAVSLLSALPPIVTDGNLVARANLLHAAAGDLGAYDLIVQCAGPTQRGAIETQLDNAEIPHARPSALPPAGWIAEAEAEGGALYGLDGPSSELKLQLYADAHSEQMGLIFQTLLRYEQRRAVITNKAGVLRARADALAAEK